MAHEIDERDPDNRRAIDSVLEKLDTYGLGRRQFVKLLAGSAAVLAAGGTLAAVGRSEAARSGAVAYTDGKFALLNWSSTGDYQVQWANAFRAASDQLGYKSVVLDGKTDAAVQSNQFNQLLTQKTTAIFCGLNDPGALPTLAQDSNRSGVLFQAAWNSPSWYTPWHSDADGQNFNTFLMPDEYVAVSKAVDVLAKHVGEQGTIVRVGGYYPSIDGAEVQRRLAVHDTLKKYPKIKFAGELHAKYDADLSQRAAASLLARFPDTVGIVAVNDDAATGVVAGIEAAGKVPGKDVFVVGANGSTAGIERVLDGRQLVTTGNVPAYPSFFTVAQFHDRLRGWKPTAAERTYGWHAEIITKANAAPFKARYVDGPIGESFDVKLLSRTEHPDDFDLQFDGYPIEDLEGVWPGVPKPKDFVYPEAYLEAQRSGEFDRVRALYKDHYRSPVLGPSPYRKAQA
ncbi:sugar ABC transporter substrate-binding protein [Gordonia soli]|uniref:Putative ABC transporter substrate-binding protein n=1 Tax=Gordonia soli NBRC 108243 TaxID=1223545 RepID=M0QKK1_9ACTN|nr:sugar ABC transporter substrate-binding protein [Gordonia soli]GAC69170.1 putative ABC transporter substrate-binding protein [Gordonia soli NBRC 108243]